MATRPGAPLVISNKIVITLSPCPFCGEDENISFDKSGGFWIVVCGWCGAVGPNSTDLRDASQNWNDRLTKAERDARENALRGSGEDDE